METNIEKLVESLLEICPQDKDCGIDKLQKQFGCEIIVHIEKIHSLQYTYYYEVDFGTEEKFYLEVESGIDNGTQLNHSEWGFNTMSNTRTQRVLKDVVLDDRFYKEGSFLKSKANAVLSANKHKIFDFHRKNNYDNYVTGGYSKMKLDPLLNKLHLDYIYDEVEVDKNFI